LVSPSRYFAISADTWSAEAGKGRIEMDVPLRDAARRVTEQSGDRQLGEPQIARDAGKGVSKDVRGHAGKFRLGANPIEHSNDTDEMPVADIGGEHVGRMLLDGLAFDALDSRDADHAELLAARGVGEVDGVLLPIEPRPLEAQGLHPPEARQQHEPDRAAPRRVLAVRCQLAHHLAKMANLVGTQPALDLP
jgi:hypothetical protein